VVSRRFSILILATILACGTAATAQNVAVSGKWQQQIWSSLSGAGLTDLTDSPCFNQPPNTTTLVASSYVSRGDNYGARTRGYITPVTTGLYTFWVAGDDQTQWSMSPNASKWDAKPLTSCSTWTTEKSWDQSIGQRTAPRYLVAGKSYYVELLHKEAGGDDHAAVAWSMQGVDSTHLQN
jgi:PA14 domain